MITEAKIKCTGAFLTSLVLFNLLTLEAKGTEGVMDIEMPRERVERNCREVAQLRSKYMKALRQMLINKGTEEEILYINEWTKLRGSYLGAVAQCDFDRTVFELQQKVRGKQRTE